MVQWTYLCVIFHVKHKTYHFRGLHLISKSSYILRWRPRWWQLLVTSQASSSATTHKIYLTLLTRSRDFHWRQNHLQILQHMKNFREGFHQPPPPPLYHGGGVNLRVRPRVKYIDLGIGTIKEAFRFQDEILNEVKPSPDHKMVKPLTFDHLFPKKITTKFLLKIIVGWRLLSRFPAKMTLVHARTT